MGRDVMWPDRPVLYVHAEDGGSMLLRKLDTSIQDYTTTEVIFMCWLDCVSSSEIIGYISFRRSQSFALWVYITRKRFRAVITSARGLHGDVIHQWSCFLYRVALRRNGGVALCLGGSREQATAVMSHSISLKVNVSWRTRVSSSLCTFYIPHHKRSPRKI